MDIWSDLQDELERYRSSVSIINQYLCVYEEECGVLIEKISACTSFEEAGEYFDALHEIQRRLSIAKFKFEFPLSDRVKDFVYHLDRDDVYSRAYWYKAFRAGLKWPSE
ncbi:hypothetical protein [Atopomonas hussainii]|uniref:hypothetical protein n=1 Tax=Atopomonas hussainii TaxID=1429083 RepID=UPI000943C983|nr:hypothetical protein [Atopomonas hussainii]